MGLDGDGAHWLSSWTRRGRPETHLRFKDRAGTEPGCLESEVLWGGGGREPCPVASAALAIAAVGPA